MNRVQNADLINHFWAFAFCDDGGFVVVHRQLAGSRSVRGDHVKQGAGTSNR